MRGAGTASPAAQHHAGLPRLLRGSCSSSSAGLPRACLRPPPRWARGLRPAPIPPVPPQAGPRSRARPRPAPQPQRPPPPECSRRGRRCAGAGPPYACALRRLRRLTGARASRRRPEAASNAEARARRWCPVRSRGLAPERREGLGREGRRRPALSRSLRARRAALLQRSCPGGLGGEPALVCGAAVPRLSSVASRGCGQRLGAEERGCLERGGNELRRGAVPAGG